MIILRGAADVNADHSLRVTPEANAQSKNRFERQLICGKFEHGLLN